MSQDGVLTERCCVDGARMIQNGTAGTQLCRVGWAMCQIDSGGGAVLKLVGRCLKLCVSSALDL